MEVEELEHLAFLMWPQAPVYSSECLCLDCGGFSVFIGL